LGKCAGGKHSMTRSDHKCFFFIMNGVCNVYWLVLELWIARTAMARFEGDLTTYFAAKKVLVV